MKYIFNRFANWMKRRRVVWIAIPYLIASSLSTFPSWEGVMALFGEWIVFFFVLAAWRLGD